MRLSKTPSGYLSHEDVVPNDNVDFIPCNEPVFQIVLDMYIVKLNTFLTVMYCSMIGKLGTKCMQVWYIFGLS